jgi:hypothetical protein
MKIGAFELNEPLPELRNPHVFAILRPWIDVGHIGHLTMGILENRFKALPLGKLSKPGSFYDYTRYRPEIKYIGGNRQVQFPNSIISYATGPFNNDFIFLHMLEPHMLGEYYTDSIVKILQQFEVTRYCLMGGMYDTVPHTKPLLVTGSSTGTAANTLSELQIKPSNYEGPTTATILISQNAQQFGIEAINLMVHLPQYAQLEDNWMGELKLLQIFSTLYNFPIDVDKIQRLADEQIRALNMAIDKEPEMRSMIKRLEAHYDARVSTLPPETNTLSPEVEEFLRDIDKQFGQS